MFSFTAMTEQEIQEMALLNPGTYPFEVVDVENKDSEGNPLKSKASGNKMIKLQLKVWDSKGREHSIYDYLVSSPMSIYKIKHFCESIGFENEYNSGQFDPKSCIGKCGSVELVIQKGQQKPNSSERYSDRNTVKDYQKSDGKIEKNTTKLPFDDDIPF